MSENGHYEQVGDIYEWHWDEGKEPRVTVPPGEFDPRDPKAPKPKAAKVEPEPERAKPGPKPKAKG